MKVYIVQHKQLLTEDPVESLESAEVVTGGLDVVVETAKTLADELFVDMLADNFPEDSPIYVDVSAVEIRIRRFCTTVTVSMVCPHKDVTASYEYIAVERTVCTGTPAGVIVAEVVGSDG